MKSTTIKFVALFILTCFCFSNAFGQEAEDRKQYLNKPLATVNGQVIAVKDFFWAYDTEEKLAVSERTFTDQEDYIKGLKQQVFESLINRELLYQESVRQKIEVDQSEIDNQLHMLYFGGATDVDLKSMGKEMDIDQEKIKSEQIRALSIEELLKRAVERDEAVIESQMKEFYEANKDRFVESGRPKVSHILIRVEQDFTDSQKTAARKKIENIQQEISKGKDFAYLAKKYSECPSNADGGNIGYIKKGQTLKEFEEAAFAMKAGDISDIVETQFGYHLIKVTDKEPNLVIPYEKVKPNIESFIIAERKKELELALIEKLKKEAAIEILEDPATIRLPEQIFNYVTPK